MNKKLISTNAVKPAIRAYLGGSFNPVHNAHIQMAMRVYHCLAPIAAQQQRDLEVSLLPNARSPFKHEIIVPEHRLAMLKLAIKETPLQINELELWQTPPVYSIDSVRTLRKSYPNDSLIFIMGMDSARSLEQWKEGLQLTDYVHLWVFDRKDDAESNMQAELAYTPANLLTMPTPLLNAQDIAALVTQLPDALQTQITDSLIEMTDRVIASPDKPLKVIPKGRIYIDAKTIAKISSTDIRNRIFERVTPINAEESVTTIQNSRLNYLNPMVYHYIIAHQLYSAV